MKYCFQCGMQLTDDARFCPICGTQQTVNTQSGTSSQTTGGAQHTTAKPIMDTITEKINYVSGGEGAVHVPLHKIFSKTFSKHSPEEGEEIFICGTSTSTPKLTDVETSWPTPWLFIRILLVAVLAFIPLYLCAVEFDNLNAIPGVMVVGSFMVPIATVMFFFEFNVPRNISIFVVIKVFLIGGAMSLLCTLILHEAFPVDELNYGTAIVVGIVEEVAKGLIVFYFIRKEKGVNYLSNGLLIGAAVGAGFAAFESAGYAFQFFLFGGYDAMMEVILLRGALSIGGHVVWTAIVGFAFMLAKKEQQLAIAHMGTGDFLKLFIVPVVLHAVWDMPIEFGTEIYLVQILLTIAAWIVVFVLLNNCLTQIATEIKRSKE